MRSTDGNIQQIKILHRIFHIHNNRISNSVQSKQEGAIIIERIIDFALFRLITYISIALIWIYTFFMLNNLISSSFGIVVVIIGIILYITRTN